MATHENGVPFHESDVDFGYEVALRLHNLSNAPNSDG